MSDETIIVVTNCLGDDPDIVEEFISEVTAANVTFPIKLDFSRVAWISPYGATSLALACRYLAEKTSQKIEVISLRKKVHAYLRRIDFGIGAKEYAIIADDFDDTEDLRRKAESENVLELAPVTESDDIYRITKRAEKILQHWLIGSSHDVDNIVSLLSEACSNVVDHSQSTGIVAIQKYDHRRHTDVELTISDLGIGIQKSLKAVHGNVADTPSDFIEQAIGGLSSRDKKGGLGLGRIRDIAIENDGYLYIRTETGSLFANPTEVIKKDDLVRFPGTQVAIKFRSSF